MSAFTGTGRLVGLALRRDRIKLPIWIVAIAGIFAADARAVIELYASTAEKQMTYATTSALSVVARVTGGPLNGPDVGAIVLNETFLFAALPVAFMSIFAVIRHTREDEETGRAELLGSTVVGRHARLAAALAVTTVANLALGSLIAVALIANDLPVAGSLATGLAVALVGITFATVAAIVAQIFESSRSANGWAAAAIGVAFLLRAVGDGLGKVGADGTSVDSSWPSWLSPIGWGQQIHPYTEANWWVLGLFVGAAVLAATSAFYLAAHRDVGRGLLPEKPGPARAPRSLLSPFGLAWRLQKGSLYGWTVAVAILGVIGGLIAKEFVSLFDGNPQLTEVFQQLGGRGDIADTILGSMLTITALVIAAFALQALLRMGAEETGGQLEPLLTTAVSRVAWIGSHLTFTLFGVAVLTLVSGLATGLSYVATTGAAWSDVGRMTGAAFVQAPAVLTLAGLVIAIFGFLPRLTVGLAWGLFLAFVVMGQLGAILRLPEWLLNLSPFTHLPVAPAESVEALPIVALASLSVVLVAIGLWAFGRRDVLRV